MTNYHHIVYWLVISVFSIFWMPTVSAEKHEHHGSMSDADHHDHSAHMKAMTKRNYTVSKASYSVPDVQLLDQEGKKVNLLELLEPNKPLALNFIFTTCTTICPVMTATFAQMRRQLGESSDLVNLVSITIDPEYDRPSVLKKYAQLFDANEGWSFLTGGGRDIVQVLRSFNSYAGSKMNHQAVTLLKHPNDTEWIRIDGLASGEDLADVVSERLLN